MSKSASVEVTPPPGSHDDRQNEALPIDSDGDGLRDEQERNLGTDPQSRDSDSDGLSDGEEANTHHSNPLLPDTDGGGINDGFEVARGTSPTFAGDDIPLNGSFDTDGDGLIDREEKRLGTDPNNRDTDGDGLSDGAEALTFLTDPLDPDSDNGSVQDGPEVSAGTQPLAHPEDDRIVAQDSDDDGLANSVEQSLGTDPLKADSDGDGLTDGAEVNTVGSHPLDADTDGGGVSDGAETDRGTDPLNGGDDDGPGVDSDNDGLTDVQEIALGTDPANRDTDYDGLADGAEFLTHSTDPKRPDTDGGGEKDGSEVEYGRDPLNAADDNPYMPLAIIFVKTPSSPSDQTAGSFVIKTADSRRVAKLSCGVDAPVSEDLKSCQENIAFNYAGLAVGAHTFSVQVIDTNGYEHNAEYTWQIVAGAPADPCDGPLTTKSFTVNFVSLTKTCAFGKSGNLAKRDGYIQATGRQALQVNLPTGAKLCDIKVNFIDRNFQFDDHFALAWNGIALATNADYLLSAGSDGYPIFDFAKVRGRAFGLDRTYCLGQSAGSRCTIPAHDSGGRLSMSLDQAVVEQVRRLFASQRSHVFSLNIVGDNDGSDCKHGGLQFGVQMSYSR